MAPLDRHKVIPTRWSEHHQPVAQATMTGTCDIWEPAPPGVGFDTPEPTRIREAVPCRVQQHHGGADDGVAAGQHITERRYLVTLPLASVPADLKTGPGGHVLTVTAHPSMHERRFHVDHVLRGTELWEWDLICTETTTQNRQAEEVG